MLKVNDSSLKYSCILFFVSIFDLNFSRIEPPEDFKTDEIIELITDDAIFENGSIQSSRIYKSIILKITTQLMADSYNKCNSFGNNRGRIDLPKNLTLNQRNRTYETLSTVKQK